MQRTTPKIKSTMDLERIPFNEWMIMFNVSSQYKEPVSVPKGYFNMNLFKERIKTIKILNNNFE